MSRTLAALCLTALSIALPSVSVRAHDPVAPAPPPGPRPAGALPLTRQMLDLSLRLRQAGPPARAALLERLVAAARGRRHLLEALIDDHPDDVLRSALSPGERALLPAEAQALLETEDDSEGIVEVFHADTPGGGRYLHALRTPRGPLALRLAGRMPDLLTGDRVRVRGVRLGATLAAGGDGVTVLEAVAISGTVGDQPTLVIAINFSNTVGTYTAATVDAFRGVVFGTGASVAGYVREASYQRAWLSGQAVGPYTVPMTSAGCDPYTLGQLARQAATSAGVNVGQYRRLVYAFPRNGCPWAGLGTIGGSPSHAWINGGFYAGIVAHELGHGLGLYHSHSLECGTVTIGGACSSVDYGDTLDVMGSGSAPLHLNASQKERLGWLNVSGAPPITSVQQSGVYALVPYESTVAGAKALKIPLPGGDWYYVEYRQATGFDASIPLSVRNGVVVHRWTAFDPDGIFLLDMTPLTSSWMDPALAVNLTFVDAATGISLTPLWATTTDAGVSVSLAGAATCTRANPSIAVSPAAATGPPGSRLTYGVSVTNRDSAGCPSSTFSLQAGAGAGWTVGFTSAALTIGPGATAGTSLDVTSPVTASPGSTSISVSAADTAAPSRVAATSLTYTVDTVAAGTVIDEFDRPDAAALGNGWTQVTGQFFIDGAEAWSAATSTVHKAVLPALAGAGQAVRASFARMSSGGPRFGLLLRYQDDRNYYACYRQTGGTSKLRIVRVVNGTETLLAQASIRNPLVGKLFELSCRAEGTALTLTLDGATTISATDATFAGGSVGLLMGHASSSGTPRSHRADHFHGSVQ